MSSATKAIARAARASQTLACLPRDATGPSKSSSPNKYANVATNNAGKRAQRAHESQASASVASNHAVTRRCNAKAANEANSMALISAGQEARSDLRWISKIATPAMSRKLAK